jgi:diguanylate cyclase (GGDEF)-like protein/PAS domain S-box-containing protein
MAGFTLLALIIVAGAASSAWLTREHRSHLDEMEARSATVSLLQDAEANGTLAILLLQRYLVTGDETEVAAIRSSAAAVMESLAAARAQEERNGHEEPVARIDTTMAGAALLPETVEQVIALRQSGDVQKAAATLETALLRLQPFQRELNEAVEQERQEATALRGRADRTGGLAFWFAAIAGAVGAALGMAASALIARSILKPLSSLESAALAVAGGDLNARARPGGPRELARLGASLNQMTEALLDASKRRELEEALRRSEQQFRSLIENASDIITVLEGDGAIRYTSPSVQGALGYTPEELRGKNVFGFVHPDDLQEVLGNFSRLLQDPGGHQSVEFRFRHGDGSWHTLEAIGKNAIDNPAVAGVVVNSRDITAHNQAEEALKEAEAKYRTLVEQIPAITYVDTIDDSSPAGFTPVYVSPQIETMLGYSAEEFERNPELWQQALHPEDRERALSLDAQHYATGQPISSEYRLVARDGRAVWVQDRAVMVEDASGRQKYSQGVLMDITERKRAEEELREANCELAKEQREIEGLNRSLERKVKERTRELRLANRELQQRNRQLLTARAQAVTDALTGLHNHRAFHERVRDEVSRAHVDGADIGLIMMDIDGFKSVNDSLGHLAGDRILRRLARTLARAVPQDNAYRYGGDEFAVLLPGASCGETMALAEQLRRSVERHVNGSGEKVTVSLGVACYPDTASSAEELIYGSDAAMYWAKSAGKNCVGDWSNLVRHRAEGVLPWYAADRAIRAPDTVSALVAALAAKDPATASHTERCSWYAARLAEELGLGERDTSIVRLSSLLHDIGKLAVPDYVLFKPGPLDDHEWTLMRQHPVTALHILGQIRSVADATPAILHHHEHFDGSGYPDGLAGDRIPIASRILLVSDAFDAMTTDRPYRKAMPVEAALEELKSNAGTQFDPEVVEAFLRILEQHGAKPLTWKASGRPGLEPVGAAGHAHGDGR